MIEIEDKVFYINAYIEKGLYDLAIKNLKETIKIIKNKKKKRK